MSTQPQLCLVGGGMITRIQILPTLYYLQKQNVIGDIHVCALNSSPIRELQDDTTLAAAFPGQSFTPHPNPAKVRPDEMFPDMYKDVFSAAPTGSIAVVAVPDQLHYPVV